MFRTARSRRSCIVSTAVVALASPWVSARPNGFAVDCGGCHYGQLEGGGTAPPPEVNVASTPERVEPGESVELRVTVQSQWSDAVVAGFLVMTEEGGGMFTSTEEGVGNVGIVEGQPLPHAIGHTAARALVGNAATFVATWTAPSTPKTYHFQVFGVTSDDGDGTDDPGIAQESNEPVGRSALTIAVGCDPIPYYRDSDEDGYGKDEVLSCDPPPGYATLGGDCDDTLAAVNPGAEELCSFRDENCDGDPMAPPPFYRDVDGDGFGVAGELVVDGCVAPEGYAPLPDDCDPLDPNVHPGAAEISGNGRDDNCNGAIDEEPSGGNQPPTGPTSPLQPPSAQPSAPSSAPPNTQPSTAPTAMASAPTSSADETRNASNGCHVALPYRSPLPTVVLAWLSLGWMVRRRRTR